MAISANLKILRNRKQVSQQEVANYLNISRQAYNFYENGKRQPDYEILLKLTEYFNVSVDDLLGDIDSDFDETLVILNRKAKSMSPQKRKKLLEVIDIIFAEEDELL